MKQVSVVSAPKQRQAFPNPMMLVARLDFEAGTITFVDSGDNHAVRS